MKDTIVRYKTAKLAKEKGFNWKAFSYYKSEMSLFNIFPDYEQDIDNWNDITSYINCYSAPTQSLLQRWLREVHNIHITVTSISQESWQYHIQKPKDKLGDNYNEDYENYEESLEDGLSEALKLIKNE